MAYPFKVIDKDPQALLDYTVDWSSWLVGEDQIASVSWTVPAGITQFAATFTGTTATIWLSGGSAGESYDVVCHVVTDEGREDDRTLRFKVAHK